MAKRRTSRKAAATRLAAASTLRFYYLIQFSYTADAWDDLIKNPGKRDRAGAVYDLITGLGGCFAKITFPCDTDDPTPKEKLGAFGEHDVVALVCFRTEEAAAAFAMAVTAGGGVKSFKTTRVLPWKSVEAALTLAANTRTTYAPPGKVK